MKGRGGDGEERRRNKAGDREMRWYQGKYERKEGGF